MGDSELQVYLSLATGVIPQSKISSNPNFPWHDAEVLAAYLAEQKLKPTHANILLVANLAKLEIKNQNLELLQKTVKPIITTITSG